MVAIDADVATVDKELVTALSAAAGLVIEIARLREQSEVCLRQERERIATALCDEVIHELFAVVLALVATASLSEETAVVNKLAGVIEHVDATIHCIRNFIFQLKA